MIYLENRQLEDVFNQERIEVLKHLSSQFGISMENALLYDSLNRKVQECQESESRFRSFVENANEAIMVTQDEAVKYSNRQITKLTGFSQEEMHSLGFDKFIHPEDLEIVLSEYRARVSGERPTSSYSVRIITKAGQEKYVFVNSTLVDWDGRPATLAMLTDITEVEKTRKDLEESETRFRLLMEESPLAIELLSPDGKINKVNTAWHQLWGLSEEEAAEVVANYNMLTDQQIKDQGIAPLVEKAFAGEHVILPTFQYSANRAAEEIGLEISDLNAPWIQSHLYSVKDENGNIAYVVNIYMELTKLKQAEQEAHEQKEILARIGRTSRMGQLTGSIAHELSQPLTGILSNAQALEMILKKDRGESGEMTEIVEEIIADAKRSGSVIRNLRDLYREQKGKFEAIDINTVVDETIKLLHSEFIIQHIIFAKECAPSLPKINGNKIQLQQVLVNLIMNGIQAMSDLAREDRHLLIRTALDKMNITVWVEDNGPGIPVDKIDIIFEPLTTWKPGGTGMGLAISNSIIKAHGGKMWAENKPEGGARVAFALPVLKKGQKK
jgi:PAS domain S-box-containing protein